MRGMPRDAVCTNCHPFRALRTFATETVRAVFLRALSGHNPSLLRALTWVYNTFSSSDSIAWLSVTSLLL